MKQVITLFIFLLGITQFTKAQFVSYETQSKWIFGFNVGGTWSTTDVKYKTYGGWGMTLGRSFNYDYGRRFSFDLRGRYLGGTWYGQAFDSTELSNYNGTTLMPYKLDSTMGFSVNNFQATVHELSLELVLHANRLRERSRWDPYIFGGIGLSWHQTYGDLRMNDTLGEIYAYDPSLLTRSYINSLTDQIYETALDGTTKDQFRVGVMPSLGFGIGYQVAPRVTIGVEHKSTFTQIDDFDGFVRESKYKQDIYHYTSGFVQVRFKARDQRTPPNPTSSSSSTSSNATNSNGCVSPVINIIQPSSSGSNSGNINYNVIASIANVERRQEIIFKVNGVPNLNYNFNPQTDRFESSVILNQGMNTFELSATNACGSATQTSQVNFTDCQLPVLTRINPSAQSSNVSNPSYSFVLNAQNNVVTSGITVTINDRSWTGFTYNSSNGQINGSVTLQPGQNVFVIKATNACGTVTETFTVNYQNCIPPVITMTNPTISGTTVNTASFILSGTLQQTENQGIKITHNNRSITNFSYNAVNGALQSNLNLLPGLNTFVITATNACGSDSETITINFLDCIAPNITLLNPVSSGTTVTTSTYLFKATAFNVGNAENLILKQNGAPISAVNFNSVNNQIQAFLTLTPGVNTIVLSASNACGMDAETTVINYNECIAPVLTVSNPVSSGITLTQSGFSLSGTVSGLTGSQQLQITQNGQLLNGVALNGNAYSANVTLVPGTNTFTIKASNTCGVDTKTTVVQFNNCVPPVITIVSPVNGSSTTSNTIQINAQIGNANGNAPTITVNNRSIVLSGYNAATGTMQMSVPLIAGQNTITITVSNACGTDTETLVINNNECVAPVVAVSNPASSGITVTQAAFSLSGTVSGLTGSQQLQITQNGQLLNGVALNGNAYTANVILVPGTNTFNIKASNTCGVDTKTTVVQFNNCVPPVITIVSPVNGSSTTSNTIQINAQIGNANGNAPTITVNNRSIVLSGYNAATGTMQMSVPLIAGQNTITITVSNACGTDTETLVINNNECVAPVVAVSNPASSGITLTQSGFSLSGTVSGLTGSQQLQITQNGQLVNGVALNGNAYSANVTLVPGTNTFTIKASNTCGVDTKTTVVQFNNCVPPVITIVSPVNGSSTTSNTIQINAQIGNANGNAPTITVNNRSIVMSGYNAASGSMQMNVPLIAGQNTITITVSNACGTDTETITILSISGNAGSGNVNTDVNINGSSIGTGVGRPGSGTNSGSSENTGNSSSGTGTGSSTNQGNSNGSSIGTGVGRPGSSGGGGNSNSGNTNGTSGTGTGNSGTGTGSSTSEGTSNGNSIETGTGRPGNNTGSGSGTGGNTPTPIANPGNSGNNGSGKTGTRSNSNTKTSTGTGTKGGNIKSGQTPKSEDKNQEQKSGDEKDKNNENAPEQKSGQGTDKSGGG